MKPHPSFTRAAAAALLCLAPGLAGAQDSGLALRAWLYFMREAT